MQGERLVVRYEQTAEQSAELLRLIVPRIAQTGGHFSPWAYAVWYEHLAGTNSSLSEALETRLRLADAVTKTEIIELYAQYIQAKETRSLSQLQAGLGDLLRKLGDIAAESGRGAAAYYQALISHEEELASVLDADTLRTVLEALKNSTVSVRVKASRLHSEIEAGREHMQSLYQQLESLRTEALADPLSGLNNRRGFDRACERLYGHSDATCQGAALVLLDVDHFKHVNDTYGHLLGDQVLRTIAGVITTTVKGGDVVVRFGGDEFLVLLPDTPVAGAAAVAEQIRSAFGRVRIRRSGTDLYVQQLTLSAGVAVAKSGETVEQLVHRADQALLQAKTKGRNCMCIADAPPG
jgi:diguanylate cyclase